jgi:hypothetical protein
MSINGENFRVLYLDDRQNRVDAFLKTHPDAIIVRTACDCICELQNGFWNEVWLDHDLNDQCHCSEQEKNDNHGMTVVRWICANLPTVRTFVVHSTNPIRDKMVDKLRKVGYLALKNEMNI